MTRPALASVVLAVVTVFVAASPAVAKLPPGTAFEACGASGCRTATGEEALEVSLSLLEPTIEHGDAGAPSGAAAWIRVDISFPDRGKPGSPRWLRSIERRFPVIFVPDAESLGVPRGGDTYRWVSLRSPPARARSYTQVAEGVQPFPAQVLAVLDPVAVARGPRRRVGQCWRWRRGDACAADRGSRDRPTAGRRPGIPRYASRAEGGIGARRSPARSSVGEVAHCSSSRKAAAPRCSVSRPASVMTSSMLDVH
jgi:hypothetical protein